jgi:hypothetical protein
MNVKRDKLELKESISEKLLSPMTDEDWKKAMDAVEFFSRFYMRYRCIDIASRMNLHGSAQETMDRAEKFVDFIFDEEDDND